MHTSNQVLINNKQISVKEYRGLRIVTISDIALIHDVTVDVIRNNYENNIGYMKEGKHYFMLGKHSDLTQTLVKNNDLTKNQLDGVNEIPVFIEKGYLMIVKLLQGKLHGRIREEMIAKYFQVIGIPSLVTLQIQLLIQIENRQKEIEQRQQILEYRINNLDTTNIEGTPRQRLKSMIQKYAFKEGIPYNIAWHKFKINFNRAYAMNIEQRYNSYIKDQNIKAISYPDFLEKVGLIEDGIRVADKMLNYSTRSC